jgi:MFS family permease
MAIGVGTCAGPVLGSIIYTFVGYSETFGCFALLIFVSFLVALFVVPKRLNAPDRRSLSMEQRGDHHRAISYSIFFTNFNAVLLILTAIMTMVFEFFMDPIIGL